MRFVIVTGMSGAGKSTALKMLEDAEYFCVDNLPIPLVEKFAQLTADGTSGEIQKVAVGIDIRSGQALPDLQNVLEWMSINGICYEILFLDASDDVLVKRYKETRRTHPLAGLGRVDEGIRKERKALEFLKKDADYILDTSQLLTRELKAELDKIFVQDQKFKNLMITVLSFGFKYGIPADSDLVFDVRFLPNPYYVEGMRPLSGNDAPVRDYVMGFETAQVFAEKLEDMIRFLIPNYISEGKHQLMEELLATREFPLPESLVQRFYREHQRDAEHYLKKQHADEDTIRKMLEHMHEESMTFARKKAKGHTFLLALAQKEGISVSGKEAEDAVRAMTRGTGQNYEDLRKTVWEAGVITAMQERMIADRALDRLYGAARKVMAESPMLRPFSEIRKEEGKA